MSCQSCGDAPNPSSNFLNTLDVTPVCVPCDGIGYKAPFRKEPPYKMIFICQWYIEKLELEKRFVLSYYDFDGTIELRDIDRHTPFLRRMRLDSVKLKDLFPGNKLLVLTRHMVVLDYADSLTREYIQPKCERAFLLVRPEVMEHLPQIIQRIEKCFRILRGKIVKFPLNMSFDLSENYKGEEKFLEAVRSLDGLTGAAFLVMGEEALAKMKNLVGESEDPQEALLKHHKSLRALYGIDILRNGFFYSESHDCVIQHARLFFDDNPRCALPCHKSGKESTTCCVIKPHIMREGRTGTVLADIIASGFKIEGMGVFWLNRRQAEEFYEIYKRIFVEAEFMAMVDELSIGPCMAVELSSKCEKCPEGPPLPPGFTVAAFRQVCGPHDSSLARQLRPCTLRAKHGLNKIQNAVHCTEMPEDAESEIEYFLTILDKGNPDVSMRSVTGLSPYLPPESQPEGCPC